MSEDILQRIYDCLQRLEAIEDSQLYDAPSLFSVGGVNGNYFLRSPYNTECEVALIQAFSMTAASNFYISYGDPSVANLGATFPNIGASPVQGGNAGAENNAFNGWMFRLNSGGTLNPPLVWCSLGKNVNIYINTVGAATSFVTFAFRRKLSLVLPDTPRQHPHTHSHVQSRAALRRLAAMSPQVAGFETRYPVPGGAPYHQMGTPTIPERDLGIVPISQDTGVFGDKGSGGIMPNIIGPTTRKMGAKKRG